MKKLILILLLSFNALFISLAYAMEKTPAPKNAALYIIAPQNNVNITNPIKIIFGLKNMGVAPAGIKYAQTGHHHLLINLDNLPSLDRPIPSDKNHIHFGKGQTETTIQLPPGEHTLQLILGDHHHIPHDPAVISEKITIFVN